MNKKWLYGPERCPGLSRNGPQKSKMQQKVAHLGRKRSKLSYPELSKRPRLRLDGQTETRSHNFFELTFCVKLFRVLLSLDSVQ